MKIVYTRKTLAAGQYKVGLRFSVPTSSGNFASPGNSYEVVGPLRAFSGEPRFLAQEIREIPYDATLPSPMVQLGSATA